MSRSRFLDDAIRGQELRTDRLSCRTIAGRDQGQDGGEPDQRASDETDLALASKFPLTSPHDAAALHLPLFVSGCELNAGRAPLR